MYKIAVMSSTGGTNFQSLLDAQKRGEMEGIEIVCLVTNKPDCGARKRADEAGIPVIAIEQKGKTREEFDNEVIEALAPLNIDLIVLGGYMRIISEKMVEIYKNRIINIHPSLLPKFAGGMNMDVHQSVIDAGEQETGMTIHIVDDDVDTGTIVLQKSCEVKEGDSAESLKDRVQGLEKEWYPKVVKMFADGEIEINS